MTQQQHPNEYIITEKQVTQIQDEYPFTARDIRSRPHPAPALGELKHDLEFKQACIENQAMHINTLNAKMIEMMQGAARKAREEALHKLRSKSRQVTKKDYETGEMVVSLVDIAESLRSTQQQAGDERE